MQMKGFSFLSTLAVAVHRFGITSVCEAKILDMIEVQNEPN